MTRKLTFSGIWLALAATALSACGGGGSNEPGPGNPQPQTLPGSPTDPVNPPVPPADGGRTADVLLYNGIGVDTSDWQNTEKILKANSISYTKANGTQLDAMSLEQMKGYGMFLFPGGQGGTITQNIKSATRIRVRQAVRDHGVNYVGFCAGAWISSGPEAETDTVAGYGLAVAKGPILPLFRPKSPLPKADMVPVTFADGSTRQLVWFGGPSTPEWSGGVVARYVNGAPAISQTRSGKGFVVISGPHPEAPQSWRDNDAGFDSDGLDYDIAIAMIKAALNQQPMPAFQ